ncbi:glycoside hydrolase family 93 protein [Hypoxylon trugodes]|uniref:glycoside hydrolase family 93 protein n=1 Tax=Hypoxylon trugodes TaxID=326681 RepID=UPI002191FBE3|nr:glycoside hydrolase family 93 protein [Hypoxylon trugodes]KAI1385825.1 glycoside hydrolase family 93 protein [Hypoxylon trugodes]
MSGTGSSQNHHLAPPPAPPSASNQQTSERRQDSMAGRLTQKILGHIGHLGPLLTGEPNVDAAHATTPASVSNSIHAAVPAAAGWNLDVNETILNPAGGTYPRLCRLSDSSLLSVTTGFQGPGGREHVLQVSRSTDNGTTFVPHGEITRGAGDIDNGFLLEVPPTVPTIPGPKPIPGPGGWHGGNGTSSNGSVVLAAFRNHDRDANSHPTYFRITVCRSEDGGRTWRFASQAAEQSAASTGGLGIWEPYMRLGPGGRNIQLTYSRELAHNNQETFRVDSYDGGRSWTAPPRCLRCHPPFINLRDGMQSIVGVGPSLGLGLGLAAQDPSEVDNLDLSPEGGIVARDGQSEQVGEALVVVFETTRFGTFSVEYAVSYDGGLTWGSRGVVYRPRQGRNAGAPQIERYGNGGGLAVVFMTDEDTDTPQWPGKAAIKVVFASGLPVGGRGAIRWSQPMVVHQAPSFWPGLFSLGQDELMVVFEHGGVPIGKRLRWG